MPGVPGRAGRIAVEHARGGRDKDEHRETCRPPERDTSGTDPRVGNLTGGGNSARRRVHGEPAGYRLRPDAPRINRDAKRIEYETPRGATMSLDVPPSARALLHVPLQASDRWGRSPPIREWRVENGGRPQYRRRLRRLTW
jgi:hypothetical protein